MRVVFGRDSRPSGTWVRDAAVAALVASGMEVIDLDIVTTPGVAMMVRHLDADAGIIATASHNPIEWNGLKFLNRDAVAPPPADAQAIADLYDADRAEFVRGSRSDPAPPRHADARPARQARSGSRGCSGHFLQAISRWCSTASTAPAASPRPRCSASSAASSFI